VCRLHVHVNRTDKQRYTARKIFQLAQDEAPVDGRAAVSGNGFRRGDERLNFSLLFVSWGQVVLHQWVQCLVFLSKK
jgi:hypothetical protein